MAQFTVNPQRFDPYKNFKFRVKWDARYVAGVSKCGSLKRTTDVVEHREGGDPSTSRKSPARKKYDPITLERSVTHDTEFEKSANKVWDSASRRSAEVAVTICRVSALLACCVTISERLERDEPDWTGALSIGGREVLLLHIRGLTCGGRLPCTVQCPRCAESMDFALQAD